MCLSLFFCLPLSLSSSSFAQDFPVKGEISHRVEFWKKVYTEISTQEAFLHDDEDLRIIYEKVSLPENRKLRGRFLRKLKNDYKQRLRSLSKKRDTDLSPEEKKLKELLGERSSNEYYQLSRNLRFQYGLRDRYFQGLKRSYRYMDFIEKVFKDLGMPEELKFLPHVESSFNYQAYSKVGAAGIWQFMRSTARLYRLKVNYVVDERRDVFKATKAAAQLLKANFKKLGSWPLALTAYNHGAASINRAVKNLGTDQIHEIVERYKGRRFGFASKNFYATFMATVQISKEPQKYFPEFSSPGSLKYSQISLPKAIRVDTLIESLEVDGNTFKEFNPSIRRSAYRNKLFLPKGLQVYFPPIESQKVAGIIEELSKMEASPKEFTEGGLHIVSRGESLFDISKMYQVSLNDVIAYNDIVNPSRIFAGMKIKIPGKNEKVSKVVAKIEKTEPIVVPTPGPVIAKKDPPSAPLNDTFYGPSVSELKNDQQVSLIGYDLDIFKKRNGVYQVTIETEETLGHLAEWAGTRAQKIRDLNRLSFGSLIYFGQKLLIPIKDEELPKFKQERNSYHLSLQEDFFESYEVAKVEEYAVKRGDTLTEILNKFEVPFWLLRKSQENQILSGNLVVAQKILIPKVRSSSEPSGLIIKDEDAE